MPNSPASENADIETSSEDYARRFSGEVGQWLLSVQELGVKKLLGQAKGRSLLDLGGGHAQLAAPLLAAGFKVTVAGSSQVCAERLKPLASNPNFKFEVANLVSLPFKQSSFDCVVSVRYISHCSAWPSFVRELCLAANGPVIIDYPRKGSFNLLYGLLFGLKKKLEGNTRTFLVFKDSEIADEFRKHGYLRTGLIGQFCLPMVLHRRLKRPQVSKILEGICALLCLPRLIGTPALARFEKLKGP